jgi:hypothetical protein
MYMPLWVSRFTYMQTYHYGGLRVAGDPSLMYIAMHCYVLRQNSSLLSIQPILRSAGCMLYAAYKR